MKRLLILGMLGLFLAGCFDGGGDSGGGNANPVTAGGPAPSVTPDAATAATGGTPAISTSVATTGGVSGGSADGAGDLPVILALTPGAPDPIVAPTGPTQFDATAVPESMTGCLVTLGLGAIGLRATGRRRTHGPGPSFGTVPARPLTATRIDFPHETKS